MNSIQVTIYRLIALAGNVSDEEKTCKKLPNSNTNAVNLLKFNSSSRNSKLICLI